MPRKKKPSATLPSENSQTSSSPSPQHDTINEKEEEDSLLNYPQNGNGQRKHHLPCVLRKQGALSSSHHHLTTPPIPLIRSAHLLGREDDLKGENR
eukprot:14092944-Ditylum_brightwellii.AAC.1